MERALNDKSPEQRTRNEYLKVIDAYQRVYVITPHTNYADNALLTMAHLYEEAKDSRAAIRTLHFLIQEYPKTPFRDAAERDIARLQGVSERKLPSVAVDNIRFWETGNAVRVVVDLSSQADFVQGGAKSPDRVFIDIAQARVNSILLGKPMTLKSPLIQQIRVGQYDNSTVRVVLDLGAATKVTSSTLRDPDRLIIDVVGPDAPPVLPGSPETTPPAIQPATPLSLPPKTITTDEVSGPAASSTPATSVATSNASKAAPKPAPPTKANVTPPAKAAANEARITPAKPTSNGDRSLIRSLGLKLQKVVIDAGHGGHDTGTIGPSGLMEKELVLDVAKRLKTLIEDQIGAQVLLTRQDDTFVPLESRTALANEQSGDLFISIHANSSRTRTVRGVETFYLNITTSRESLDTATRENAASERSIHELQDLLKQITLKDKVDESRELARFVQQSMSSRKNAGTDRGVKQAPFIVLMGANMPSVLVEVSFISNPQEEKLLRTPEYRQQIAESILGGVRSYSESLSGLRAAKNQNEH
jgi:N-acetylmuramoyl-L-alanine amidase